MSSPTDRASSQPRRLRIPKALVVALVGSSATLAVSFSGCDTPTQKIASDPAASVPDGAIADADTDASIDGQPDAQPDAPPDVAIDARPDAPPDARPDARPDAPVV
jgi:hypothetical protein